MNLTGEEKGALLLLNLAPQVVDHVLAQLGPDRDRRMRAIMSRLQASPNLQQALDTTLLELGEALEHGPRPESKVREAAGFSPILSFPAAEKKSPSAPIPAPTV